MRLHDRPLAGLRIAGALIVLAAGAEAWVSPPARVWADSSESVPIARVLTDPDSFNLDVVTLAGTIREIRQRHVDLECGSGAEFVLYLRDETGELAILNEGTCAEGVYVPAVATPFTRGERVTVRAVIVRSPRHDPEMPPVEATLIRIDRPGD